MPRGQKFKAEEIISKLREAEVDLARGKKIPEACKQIGVTLPLRSWLRLRLSQLLRSSSTAVP